MLHRLKFGRRYDLAPRLARRFDPSAFPQADWDLIVPVPLHPWRLMRRGYDQGALLARFVAAKTGCEADYRAVKRWRRTQPQARLSATARRENVRGAFRVRKPARVAGRRVLVIDDVMTTGATTGAIARALRASGASSVDCWTVARVD
ncbi:MAG: ComF family protein [Myxococcota bacterium]|jgi:ComF family protein